MCVTGGVQLITLKHLDEIGGEQIWLLVVQIYDVICRYHLSSYLWICASFLHIGLDFTVFPLDHDYKPKQDKKKKKNEAINQVCYVIPTTDWDR